MTMRRLNFTLLALLAMAACAPVHAAEAAGGCRLRGGDVVPLPAEACVREGGVVVPGAPAAEVKAAASAPAAAPVQLSADPKVAGAQQAILAVLGKPVVGASSKARVPEGVERQVKFDGCTLAVEEDLRVDYGNLVAARQNFRIASTVDFRAVSPQAFGVLGEVGSKGGDLTAQAVSVEEPSQRGGNHVSISVALLEGGTYRKFATPAGAPYWEAPRDNFWMKDGYGYVRVNDQGYAYTGKIMIVYLVNSADDAALLKKAFDEMSAACRR